ncbi:hypothetical protein D3C72_1950950 [compost metagenome]
MVGVKTHFFQIGSELQPLITLGLGPQVEAQVAHGTSHIQRIDRSHEFFRQWRQCIYQRRQRRKVKAVGLYLPAFPTGLLTCALTHLQLRLPASLADVGSQ